MCFVEQIHGRWTGSHQVLLSRRGPQKVGKTSSGTVTKIAVYNPVGGAMRINISGGSNTLYYLLKDHLGSASIVTDASGTIVGEDRFYPYGETRFTTGTMYTDQLFTGQREITGLGIYHYGARFYSPKLGRFLSPDTIVQSYANPQTLNRYSYVLGNPLRYTDPTGHTVACDPYEGDCEHEDSGSSNSNTGNNNDPNDPTDDADDPNPGCVGCSGGGGHPLLAPYPNTDYYQLDLLDLPPSPFPCEWIDCALSAISILASGIITAAPEVLDVSVPAFAVDAVVTYIAIVRTNDDYAHGKISKERQWILNGTGFLGALPIPYFGLGLSIINGMATGSGYPP